MERSHHSKFTIDSYQNLPSTNDLMLELAHNHQINHNHVIVADSQDQGHGRYGRDWSSPKGNLYFSLLVKPNKQIEEFSLLSFVAAIALSKTIEKFRNDSQEISHKWPNDILINDKKVAGILLKSDGNISNPSFIIIGIGLNINSHPEDTNFKATNLESEKISNLNREEILKEFLDNFDIFYEEFLNFGFAPIRNLWLKKAFRLNKTINVNLVDQKMTACFKDLNNSGNLILGGEDNEVKIISSAEIFS